MCVSIVPRCVGDVGRLITLKNRQETILLSFRAGKSQRAIERETGINKKTISNFIKDYEAKQQQLLAADCDGKDDTLEPKETKWNRQPITAKTVLRPRLLRSC